MTKDPQASLVSVKANTHDSTVRETLGNHVKAAGLTLLTKNKTNTKVCLIITNKQTNKQNQKNTFTHSITQ